MSSFTPTTTPLDTNYGDVTQGGSWITNNMLISIGFILGLVVLCLAYYQYLGVDVWGVITSPFTTHDSKPASKEPSIDTLIDNVITNASLTNYNITNRIKGAEGNPQPPQDVTNINVLYVSARCPHCHTLLINLNNYIKSTSPSSKSSIKDKSTTLLEIVVIDSENGARRQNVDMVPALYAVVDWNNPNTWKNVSKAMFINIGAVFEQYE